MNRKLVVLPIVIGTIGLLVFAVILAGRVPTAPQIAEIPTLMVLPSLTHPPKIAATLAQSTSTPVPNTTEEPTGDLSTPVSEQPLALIEHWAAPTTTPVTFKSQTAPIALPIPPEPVANQVVITFNPAASAQERQTYISQLGGTVIQEVTALNSVVITVPETVTNQPLPISPAIAASEPDYWVAALVVEANDSLYDQQWSLPVIGATDGWAQLPDNAPAVTIAVIDSGVCADHPDLSGRILPGYDFVSNDDTPQDDFGHGCSVTGIIAANTGNTEGIAGIAPNAQILPLRVLDERGLGTYSNVAAAIVYATDHGAQIINLSLGGSNSSTVLQNAVNYAVSKGVLVIAAAGNTGGAVLYPAAYDAVIAVTAVDSDLQRSSFSSFGPQVDLLAPGRDILTTTRDGSYRLMTGTSFAAPEAAGIAALQLAFGNSLTLGGGLLRFTPDSQPPTPTPPDNDTGTPEPTAPSVPVMRNPAAVYCLDLGYQYETVPGIGGGEDGMCIFPDGQRCEQWQFYAGQCGQQYSYCAQQGLGIVTLEDGKDPFSPVYAACTDTSGQVIGSVNELSSLGSRALGCYDGKCPEPSSESASLGTAVDPAEDWVSGLSVPTAFDWRSYQGGNWLTGVRNQGGCGSCWAFAAVGAAEAALEIGAENSYLEPDLSEQYLVSDCVDFAYGSCSGGHSDPALAYIRDKGIVDENCMGYTYSNANVCTRCSDWSSRLTKIDSTGVAATWYGNGPTQQYIKQNIVARGPVVVYIGINNLNPYWDGDIYRCSNDTNTTSIDHAVVAVGYNDTDGYWIIRNSWGTSWYQAGQWSYGGYFKVGYGECNIDRTLMAWAMQPIPAPTPLSPENNISTTDPAVTFSWSSSNSPLQVGYNLRIGTNSNPNGTSWLVNTTTTNTNYSYTFATGGTYYWHIRTATDPVNGTSSGWVTRSFIINATPPANNDFANAPIIDFPYIHTADTRWATTQSGEKTPSCGYNDGKSVWYKYVAPYNDTLTFNTWGSNFNTVLSVWRGTSLSGLTEVVCDSYQSGVSFAVTSGTTYYIRVSGWNKAAGDVVLNGTSSAVPDVAGLIQAIEQANFDGYGTIYLKPNTTYALTSAYSGQNGLPVITSNISIYGGNATISRAAAAPFRLFEVAPGTHLYLQEVTLINGVADNGGAILNHGNLALFRTTITQNHATYNGGGINGDSGSSSTISSSKFENNSAQYGGGLDSWGQVYASLTEFKNNTASTSGGGIGVGSDGRIDLYNCRFENNQAIEDGGGINTFGSVSDTGSTFIGNRATNGGAMHTGLSSSVTLNGSFVRANLASGWGGGLRNWGAMTINRALISDNQAGTGVGGGIASSSGWLTLTHSVLSNNIAVWGGAIYNDNGWLSAENTHLRYNFATYGAALYNNIPVQVGMGAQAVSETSSDELAQPRVPVSQPEPTRPGADSGNMSAQGGGGAKEVFLAVNILIGNNYASLGGGIYNHSGKITLADARIESNSASNGGGISAYADSTIILGSSQVYNNTATFAGGGIENWGLLTVTNSSFNRNQTWISSSGGGAIMNYGNLDVTSAWFTDNHSENNGGAIFSSGSSTIAWTTFQGNSTYYDGGAIWNSGAASLTDSTIKQNIAGYNGGGIANHNAPLTITGGTFDHNHASYKGGGLYLTTAGFGIGTLNSAQFKYNSANEGGAVFADGSSLAMDSSCLVANSHTAVMGSSTWITAQNNWWGAADGPSGFGAGSGDSVNDSVDYTNFSGIPFGNCAPSNDDFDHAYPIRQLPYSFTQSTVNALDTADDPRPLSCTSQISANTVWYAYTPEYNNRYRIDTIGSSYDTLISIWTGTRGHLTAVGCNNNISSGNQASLLEFNATANRTYYIMVSGVNNQSGLQTISVTSAASAAPGLNLSNNRAFELSWGHLSWAIAYEVQLDRSSAFTTYTDYPIGVLPREQFSVTTPELENGVYYWRVRAQKPDGNWSGWSAVGTFTINAP